jgi:hypothetical protein
MPIRNLRQTLAFAIHFHADRISNVTVELLLAQGGKILSMESIRVQLLAREVALILHLNPLLQKLRFHHVGRFVAGT